MSAYTLLVAHLKFVAVLQLDARDITLRLGASSKPQVDAIFLYFATRMYFYEDHRPPWPYSSRVNTYEKETCPLRLQSMTGFCFFFVVRLSECTIAFFHTHIRCYYQFFGQ